MEEFNLHSQNLIEDEIEQAVYLSGEESEHKEGGKEIKERRESININLEAESEERGGLSAEDYQARLIEEQFERCSEGSTFTQDTPAVQVIETEEYKYIGGVKNELREGFGICYYKNGNVYKGLWRNDMRNGAGIMIYQGAEIIRGEIVDDNFQGFCEVINPIHKMSMEGEYFHDHFVDYIVVRHETKLFEGEVIRDLATSTSLGKLTSVKDNHKVKKFFLGEILNYKDENGFGIYVSTNANTSSTANTTTSDTPTAQTASSPTSTMYIGFTKKKCFFNYLEMYNTDGAAYFCFLDKGQKQGFCFSFSKDGKVSFGEYKNNFKQGPFLTFSNCHNLPKSSVKMEIFYLDFKAKAVDKMETSKKYLLQNYPEFTHIFNINYSNVIAKLSEVITDELSYLSQYNVLESE